MLAYYRRLRLAKVSAFKSLTRRRIIYGPEIISLHRVLHSRTSTIYRPERLPVIAAEFIVESGLPKVFRRRPAELLILQIASEFIVSCGALVASVILRNRLVLIILIVILELASAFCQSGQPLPRFRRKPVAESIKALLCVLGIFKAGLLAILALTYAFNCAACLNAFLLHHLVKRPFAVRQNVSFRISYAQAVFLYPARH